MTGNDIVNGTIGSADISTIAPNQISPRPFEFERFDVSSSGTITTRWPSTTWVVAVVGFHTRDGDIQENGVGDPLEGLLAGLRAVSLYFLEHPDFLRLRLHGGFTWGTEASSASMIQPDNLALS